MLSVSDHRRDSAGFTYVYPVLSRRAGGLSVGINLNPNSACNWRCIYCQVPGLRRGAAPPIDLALLRRELRQLLTDVAQGDFYDRFEVPVAHRVLRDIAISGNGEATTAAEFPAVVEIIGDAHGEFGLACGCKLVLISNGSQARRSGVLDGLRNWARFGGEMWFKLDRTTAEGSARINGVRLDPATLHANLASAAAVCPVWLQTCVFRLDRQPPDHAERTAYLEFLAAALAAGVRLEGVLLYGLARPSQQPEAPRLDRLPAEWLEAFAAEIGTLGLPVRVSP